MSEEQLEKIIDELEALTKLLAINVLKDKSQTERISLLDEFGFESKVIANLLGTKDNIVRATKSNVAKSAKKRKDDKKTKKQKKKPEAEKKADS